MTGRCPANRFEQSLRRISARRGVTFVTFESAAKDWASATFVGSRIKVTFSVAASESAEAWIAGLPEAEFELRGGIVADLVVENVRRGGDCLAVELTVLTIDAG